MVKRLPRRGCGDLGRGSIEDSHICRFRRACGLHAILRPKWGPGLDCLTEPQNGLSRYAFAEDEPNVKYGKFRTPSLGLYVRRGRDAMHLRSAVTAFLAVGFLAARLLGRGQRDAAEDAPPLFFHRRIHKAGWMTPAVSRRNSASSLSLGHRVASLGSRRGRSADHPGKGRRAQVLAGLDAAAAHQQDADDGRRRRGDHSS